MIAIQVEARLVIMRNTTDKCGFFFFYCHTKSNSETFYVSADVSRLNQPSKNACWFEGGCVSYLVCNEQASAGHS